MTTIRQGARQKHEAEAEYVFRCGSAREQRGDDRADHAGTAIRLSKSTSGIAACAASLR